MAIPKPEVKHEMALLRFSVRLVPNGGNQALTPGTNNAKNYFSIAAVSSGCWGNPVQDFELLEFGFQKTSPLRDLLVGGTL